MSARVVSSGRAAIASAIPVRLIVPAKPYSMATPNRKNADENAPSRKYFSAASWDSRRRRRASPHIRYSGRDRTSSATNIVRKSPAAGNSIMPPMANMVSGNTSVWINAALVATFSATLPGTVEASGVKASKATAPSGDSARRSAISSTLSTPISRMVAHRNSVGRSMSTAPATTELPMPPRSCRVTRSTQIRATNSPARLSESCAR